MTDSFLSVIEREAKNESDRVVAELKKLRLEATQVITVLNALNLEVPQELRTLSPIEEVPKRYGNLIRDTVLDVADYGDGPTLAVTPETLIPDVHAPVAMGDPDKPKRDGGVTTPGFQRKLAKQKAKAEENYQTARRQVVEALSKGPVLRTSLEDRLGWKANRVSSILTRMVKEGSVGRRTIGFQGPSEWFLIERPVSLETLRDEVVKEKGNLFLGTLEEVLGFQKRSDLTKMLDELAKQGIISRTSDGYENSVHLKTDKRTRDEKANRSYVGNGAVAGTGRTAKLSSDKEVRQILAKAEKMGAQVKKQGNGHILVSFRGEERILAATPGDSNRSNREKLAQLGINV